MNAASPYKTSRLHVAWIQFLTVIYTLKYSFMVIWVVNFSKDAKTKVDDITHRWARSLLKPTKLSVKVVNPHQQAFNSDKPIILMCNHSSLYDIPVSFLAVPGSIRMLSKKELFSIPILGTAMKKAGFVSIDRKNREQARKDLKNARAELEKGTKIWIAPEGTRSRDGKLMAFKKGGFHLAIETGATIIPIGIRGINKVLPSNTLELVINGEVEVHIGKEIDASQYSKKQRNELTKEVETEMRQLIDQE